MAAAARTLLRPGGAFVHVHAPTHQGLDAEGAGCDLGNPPPPWPAITGLVHRYLGAQPRAGQSTLPAGTGGGETAIYRAASSPARSA